MRRLGVLLAIVAMCGLSAAASASVVGSAPAQVLRDHELRELAAETRAQLLTRLRATDRQFHTLARRISPCALARTDLVAAYRLHQRAVTRAARARRTSLLTRNRQLRNAVVRLSNAARRCAVSPSPPSPPVPAPIAVPVEVSTPAATYRVPISLANVVNGQTLDFTGSLGSLTLPAAVIPLDIGQLQGPGCLRRGAVCLGIDRPLLSSKLRELMNRNVLLLLLRNLSTVNISGVLQQVVRLITDNDLSSLIQVQRVGDRAVRMVPIGALAELTGLPDIPIAEVAQLQVVR